MPVYKKITGNYVKVMNEAGLSADFSMKDTLEATRRAIEKDLPTRTRFVDLTGRTFDDFLASWRKPTVSLSYAQGNPNGAVFSGVVFSLFMRPERFNDAAAGRTEETIEDYLLSNKNLCFAYINDNNEPCGFSISYSEKDPTLWTAAIIQNTTADPKDRTVTMVSNKVILKKGATCEPESLLSSLNSTSVQALLHHIFLKDGSANIKQLTELNSWILENLKIDHRDERARQFQALMGRAKGFLKPTIFKKMMDASKKDQDFYKDDNFFKKIDEIQGLVKAIRSKTSTEKLKSDISLMSVAIQLELKASQYITYKDIGKYKKAGLLLQAEILRQAIEKPTLSAELNYPELVREAEGPLADKLLYLEKTEDFTQALAQKPENVRTSGTKLLRDIANVAQADPLALPKLAQVLKAGEKALGDSATPTDIEALVNLSQEASKKEPVFWKKLGSSLLIFAGALMVAAGLAASAITGGLSLLGTAAGALIAGKGMGLWRKAAAKTEVHQSAEDFKAAIKEMHTAERSPADDSGLGDSRTDSPVPISTIDSSASSSRRDSDSDEEGTQPKGP